MNITYFILVVCFGFNLFMFFYFKWYIVRRTSASRLISEEKKELSRHIAEVNAAIVDINAVTDRNLLLVEDKIKQLKDILNDTVYVKDYEKVRTSEALYTNLGRGIRAALKTETDFAHASTQGVPHDPAPSLSVVRPNIITKPQVPPVFEKKTVPEKQEVKYKLPSKRQIRTSIDLLLNEGLSPEEIVSRLDISIAEVDLAMNLRRKK